MQPLNIVIVEDEEAHFQLMKRAIGKEIPIASVLHFEHAQACLDGLHRLCPDVIIADYMMPGKNGIEFLEALKQQQRNIPVIMITGQGDERIAVQAMKLGAWDYLVKTGDFFSLLPGVIEKVVDRRRLTDSLQESARLNELLLNSLPHPAMLIRRDRTILAANRKAMEAGASLGGLCWRDFARGAYVPVKDRGSVDGQEPIPHGGAKCVFCLADEALARSAPIDAHAVKAFGRLWDTSWIPIDADTYFHYAIDITERKRVEEALHVSEHFLRTIISSLEEGVIVYDREFRYRLWNKFMERLTGLREEEVLGKNALDLFPHLRDGGIDKLLERAIQGETTRSGDTHYVIPATGKSGWVASLYSPHRDLNGEIIGVVAIVHDISERKRAEEALRLSEEKYRSIFRAAKDAIIVLDHETGRVIDVNEHACQLYGYDREEMLTLKNIDLSAEPAKTLAGLQAELHWIPLRYHRKKDGSVFPVEISVNYHTHQGRRISTSVIRDITERKRAGEEIRRLGYQRELILNAAGEGIFGLDRQGRITFVNPAMAKMIGWQPEELLGESMHAISHHSKVDGTPIPQRDCRICAAFERGSIQEGTEEVFWRKDGTCFPIEFVSTPIMEGDEPTGAVTVVKDITERKRAESALRESEEGLRELSARLLSAQEAERKRIAGELHDSIGSSLSAIKIFLENTHAKMEESTPGRQSLQSVIGMIGDAMQETRRIMTDLRPSILDDMGLIATIGWFCRRLQAVYPSVRIERKIEIRENDIPEQLKIVIFRVLQEAFHNIVKYSRAESVFCSLEKGRRGIALTIEDNGVGFDVASALSKKNVQKGLGLTSMRERVELSGGAFILESRVGEGTTLQAFWDMKES